MKQPLTLALALITIFAVFVAGAALLRSWVDTGYDEYSAFHRDPAHIITGPVVKTDTELNEMWDSVGWLGKEVIRGNEVIHAYVETAWAIGADKTHTYFISCYHGPEHVGSDNLTIGYWNDGRQNWSFVNCVIAGQLKRSEGDLIILSVTTSDLKRSITPLKVAKEQTFVVNDEVLIGGVQPTVGPAYVCDGIVKMINIDKPEFVVKGWAWYGFSGGPIRLRRTGEVIGFVRAATESHVHDASESVCGDFNVIWKLLKRSGLEFIIK